MAYLAQDNQNDPNSLTGGSDNQSGGTSAPSSSGGPANTASGAPKAGNQFSNLQSLMNLNQHAPNAAANVNQNVQQGQQQQQASSNQANQNIGQAFNYNANDMNSKIQNNDFSGLKSQLATTYQGPQAGTIDTGPSNLSQIDAQTKALGSTSGQQALLQSQYGRSNYTAGQQNLDNFLQGRNGQFQQDAAAARTQGANLDQNVANQNQALNQKAGQTAQQTQQGVNNLQTGLSGWNTNLQNTTNSAVTADQTADQKVADQTAKIKSDLANGVATQDTLNNLKWDPNATTYGADFSKFVNTTGGNANFANVISNPDANRFNNINQLLGSTSPALDLNTAGTYKNEATAYDTAGLGNAVQAQQNAYNAALAPAQGNLDSANNIWNLMVTRDHGVAGGSLTPEAQAAADSLKANYGGALGGDWGQQTAWAQANQQTSQQKFNELQNQLSSQYMKKIGVES